MVDDSCLGVLKVVPPDQNNRSAVGGVSYKDVEVAEDIPVEVVEKKRDNVVKDTTPFLPEDVRDGLVEEERNVVVELERKDEMNEEMEPALVDENNMGERKDEDKTEKESVGVEGMLFDVGKKMGHDFGVAKGA